MWKQLSSKEIFSHPRITLIEDRVVLPDGVETDYIRFKESGNAVTIICQNPDGKILLQKEYSYPPNQELYQFPGGFVPADEDLETGANRELMEEEGLKSNSLFYLGNYLLNNRRSNSLMHVYLATDLVKESIPKDKEEIIKSYWLTQAEIEQMFKVDQIINVHVLASWTLYKAKGGYQQSP